ncbi:methionyl-tRNA formyltransferase [Paenibacillus turpanensis]|uniref:methionyl-tRNA formyltransferase n=1 Tax=Paenibacillus turpanensis TaxID=2689078 RepID=UPI00140DA599|nr:methionyl-tRNA formyltransferase [Paenibacillus turpanensis]
MTSTRDHTRIVFMGTPDFAVPSLRLLLEEGYHVVGVVTQPDRPKGRKKVLTPTPVKEEALKHGLPVYQPLKLRAPEAVEEVRALQPDLIITAAYGQILPKSVLDLPKHGCINVHGSLLPKYRGGAPIQRAIMNGESATGVTIMYMAEGLDTGDMLTRVEVPITDEDDSGTIFTKLSEAGAELLRDTLPDLLEGKLQAVPQNEAEASYARNLSRDDERIDWQRDARSLFNQVRGLRPFSGGFTLWNGDVLKIWRCQPAASKAASGAKPGTVLDTSGECIVVAAGEGSALLITELQPAGKKAMSAADFVRGGQIQKGTVFGDE